MKNALSIVLLLMFTVLSSTTFAQEDPDAFSGYWYTHKQSSIVHVSKTKEKFSGKIVWLKEPLYNDQEEDAGKPKIDKNNPDKKKRTQSIVGLTILFKFIYDSKNKKWNAGTIYDPEVGKNYKCEAKLEQDPKIPEKKRLNVRGYVGIPAFGRTTYWSRVPEVDLKKHKLIKSKVAEKPSATIENN